MPSKSPWSGWTPQLKVWAEAEDQSGPPLVTCVLDDGLYPIATDANAWMISIPDTVTADAALGNFDAVLRAKSPSERWVTLQRFTIRFLP